jgi:hypothetical protein
MRHSVMGCSMARVGAVSTSRTSCPACGDSQPVACGMAVRMVWAQRMPDSSWLATTRTSNTAASTPASWSAVARQPRRPRWCRSDRSCSARRRTTRTRRRGSARRWPRRSAHQTRGTAAARMWACRPVRISSSRPGRGGTRRATCRLTPTATVPACSSRRTGGLHRAARSDLCRG